ncbi:MAG: type IV pilus assembly protein PilM, partial [Planctomycetaceae bacterium]
GLTKFIKLPPIEAKKIPDIVKYEARQQIPFPLEQVVWDWQRLPGGMEEGGFVLDAEVAIFAIKRDQVYKSLAPLEAAGVEIDILQLAPVALANMAMFDQLPPVATADPDTPPTSVVVVAMGVDTTDVVITNGLRIQQRSMPIGGSTFTRALVKDMQLTFAKAEHLKRHAVRAEDPKAVFQAMRPVFNEFTSELQRSLNYFTGADRTVTIGRVLLLGNAAKLRGLSDYVAKQLQLDVQRLDSFAALEGSAVINAPAFKENRLGFGTAYGLALQGVDRASMKTNLMPGEIVRDRLIAAKRPWAVAALLGLIAAAGVNFAGMVLAWQSYAPAKYSQALASADQATARSAGAVSALDSVKQGQDAAASWQQYLVRVQEQRFQALELMRAIGTVLPRDPGDKPPENVADRHEIHVDSLDMQFFPDLATWFAGVKADWEETKAAAAKEKPEGEPPAPAEGQVPPADGAPVPEAPADPAAAVAADGSAAPAEGPTGPGWVIQIRGHHFHNEEQGNEGEQFVRSTLVHNLLPEGPGVVVAAGKESGKTLPVTEVGISYPVIVDSSAIVKTPLTAPVSLPGTRGANESPADDVQRYDFALQFAWQPTTPGSASPPPQATAGAPAP